MKKNKTESISLRIDGELKREFFAWLDDNDKTFSKWLRTQMEKELKNDKKRNTRNK